MFIFSSISVFSILVLTLFVIDWVDYQSFFSAHVKFLQRVRIARNAERCNSQRDSVSQSVCLFVCPFVIFPLLCPDEWRYDHVVFSFW